MYIGVDIGGTKCALTLSDGECNIQKKLFFPTEGKEKTLRRILDGIEELIALGGGRVRAIGISCGGPLDSARGIILSPPNLPEWRNVRLTDMLSERFGLPAYLQNDANACALAEWKFGAGKGSKNMLFLTFGTGIGSGLILDGKLYEGTNGNAGELGHIRLAHNGPVGFGKCGSFEGFCSGGGLAQLGRLRAKEMLDVGLTPSFCRTYEDLDGISARSIAASAEAGCEDALEIYRTCGEYLGRGLAIAIDLLNPERIVIGSIYTRSEHLLFESMISVLKEECLPDSLSVCRILPVSLGESIGDIAALSVAINSSANEIHKVKGDEKMLKDLTERYPSLAPLYEELAQAVDLMENTYRRGGKILVCGNGGSAADCEHIVGELMKGFLSARKLPHDEAERFGPKFAAGLQGAISAISLPSQSAILSAYCNDVDHEMVYAQLVYGYGKENDLLICLSTSGNSKNVVNAAIAARALGISTLALTGKCESRLYELCTLTLRAPESETFKVQELHLPIYHYLCAELEKRIFGGNEK